MFLPKTYHEAFVVKLQEFVCTEYIPARKQTCSVRCANQGQLETHLREKHQRNLCRVCLKHKKVFLLEQQRYTQADLELHIREGDPKHGFFGHPRCEFCRTRFYDKTHLFEHLSKDHYSCHICEADGVQHKYYRDYADLERHFRKDHFLCEVTAMLNTVRTLSSSAQNSQHVSYVM